MSHPIQSFSEFWPYYVSQHLHPVCRRLHFFGTTVGVTLALAAIVTLRPSLFALGLVFSYGPAWIGHFFFERNRPATFTYPLWSLMADFVMYARMWTGQMDAEITKSGRIPA